MKKRILVVDDQPAMRFIIRSMIETSKSNYDVSEAENGEIAFELIKLIEFDLIITDVNMPKMGGVELAQKMANQLIFSLFIFMSADDFSLRKISAMDLIGFSGAIEKPFDMKNFTKVIEKALA